VGWYLYRSLREAMSNRNHTHPQHSWTPRTCRACLSTLLSKRTNFSQKLHTSKIQEDISHRDSWILFKVSPYYKTTFNNTYLTNKMKPIWAACCFKLYPNFDFNFRCFSKLVEKENQTHWNPKVKWSLQSYTPIRVRRTRPSEWNTQMDISTLKLPYTHLSGIDISIKSVPIQRLLMSCQILTYHTIPEIRRSGSANTQEACGSVQVCTKGIEQNQDRSMQEQSSADKVHSMKH
jgi:hypothetical protein